MFMKWGRPEGGFMWAPDCVYKNGKYYFIYPHPTGSGDSWGSTWRIGVAVSDSPASGFVDQGPIEGVGGSMMIDPNVFIDDDGTAYLYCGGGSTNENAKVGVLSEDMTRIVGGMKTMQGVQDFHEAMWVFKKDGLYYLTYSDNTPAVTGDETSGNQLVYCTSTSPTGPWTYRGVMLKGNGCDTSHGSVAEYKGQWYIFYHNMALSNSGTLRSVCVDKLYFNGDGTIQTVTPSETYHATASTEAPQGGREYKVGEYCTAGGTAVLENISGGDKALAGFHNKGSYGTFSGIDGGAAGGKAKIYIRYASQDGLPAVRVNVNGKDYEAIPAMGNGSWSDYTAYACSPEEVELKPGTNNTITLSGGYFGVNIASIIVVMQK